MANTNSPFGLRPLRNLDSTVLTLTAYTIAAAYSTPIGQGDPVQMSGTVAQALAEDLQKTTVGNAHDELSWLDVQEHAVRILSAKQKVLFISAARRQQRHCRGAERCGAGGGHIFQFVECHRDIV